MSLRTSVTVKELRPGQVVVGSWDPDEEKLRLARSAFLLTAPHLQLVAATVERTEHTPDPGDTPWRPSWLLALLYEGRPYRTTLSGNEFVSTLAQHHPTCGDCGELWPCRDERLDSLARHLTSSLDRACAHCGKDIGGAWYDTFNDGVTTRRYHIAKHYRGPDGRPCHVAFAEARASLPGFNVEADW